MPMTAILWLPLADYTMTAADPEEQLLIAATTSRSGRKRVATKRFACEGYD